MKVIAFNGSPRKYGNTFHLLNIVLEQLKKQSIETKLIWLGQKPLQGCIACYRCKENKNKQCALANDPVSEYIKEMQEADGILLGSPTYCAGVSANMRALIERAVFVSRANDNNIFKHKVGASVVAVRRCGAATVFSSLNYFFLVTQMIVPGSSYWNMGVGLHPGDVKSDREGINTMIDLGDNIAWTLHKLHGKNN